MSLTLPETANVPRRTGGSIQSSFLVGSMWIAYLLNYCDRQAVFSIFPVLKRELGFTDVQLGLIGAVFLLVYAFCSPIAGELADKFSKRLLVVSSLLLWSLITILTGLSVSIIMFLCCRALIGITESLFMPAAISLTGSAYSPQARSRAVAGLMTAQMSGIVVGGWFGGYMGDRGQWRTAFFILGALGLLYAIPYYFCLKRTVGKVHAETKNSASVLAIVELVKTPSYLLLSVVFAVFTFGLWLLYGWLPTFFYEKFAFNLADAAFTATAYLQGATFIGLLAGGWLSDFLYRKSKSCRFWLMGLGMLCCAPCFHLLGNSDTLIQTKFAAAGCGILSGVVIANIFAASFEVVPMDARASSVGFLNFFGGIISSLGTLTGGLWKQSLGMGRIITIAAVAYMLAGLLMLLGTRLWFWRDYKRVH